MTCRGWSARSCGVALWGLVVTVATTGGCASAPVRRVGAVEPKAALVPTPAAEPPGRAAFTCEAQTDECWLRSLADDPLDQERAWSLLTRAGTPVGSSRVAPIASTLSIFLPSGRVECASLPLPQLQLACGAGLAPACRELYLRSGCLREAFETWSGSFAAPTWAPGTFAFLAREQPLHSKGIVFGTARRGTKVVVLGARGDNVVIQVLEERLWFPDVIDPRFVLAVGRDALSVAKVEVGPAELPTVVVAESYRRGVDDTLERAQIVRDDEDYSWVTTPCRPTGIVEEVTRAGRTLQRVRQEYDGVVLEGWIGKPILRTWGPHACSTRNVTGIEGDDRLAAPRGYEFVELDQTAAAVRKWMRGKGTLTMIEFDDKSGPRCVTRAWHAGELLSDWGPETRDDDGTVRRWRSLESFSDDGRSLAIHTSSRSSDGRHAVFRCEDTWEVVRVTDEAVEVMPGRARERERILAYHPDDVTRWWRKPEACEAALAKRPNFALADRTRPALAAQITLLNLGLPGC